jgi:hypothetical protein
MEDLTIKYFINSDPTLIEKKVDKFNTSYLWEYKVSNNIELPDYFEKKFALSTAYFGSEPLFSRGVESEGIRNIIGFKALKYAQTINWTYNQDKGQFVGSEPKELKNLIWEHQKKEIIENFYSRSDIKIQSKSYKKQNYPRGGTLKELYSQDPITYTFSSIVVDKSTQERLSKVKIKDLDKQKVTTNPNGEFAITGSYTPGQVQNLIFNLKDYKTKTLKITTLNGSIRSDVNVIELTPNAVDVSTSILKAQATTEEEKKELTDEEKKEFVKAISLKIIDEIKVRLLPFIIKKLLCEPYGVCDPIGLITLAKEAKEKTKDLNERRKERKEEKEKEKNEENQNEE